MSYVIKNKNGAIYSIDESEYTPEQLKKKAESDGWTILKPYSVADMKRELEENEQELFECEECGSGFVTEKGLKIHKSLVHK